jgi:hypothetical protein
VATTLPIIAKSSTANGLTLNLPATQNVSSSPYIPSYNVSLVSTNVIQSDYTDGIGAYNYRDTALFTFGGWGAGTPTTTDTVRVSYDNGGTFAYKTLLPYPVHTIAHTVSPDGYLYGVSGDYLSTSIQKHTVWRTTNFGSIETRTTTAPWAGRILGALWTWNGNLRFGGGQNSLTGDTLYNDIWESTDGGANWTQIVTQAIANNGDTVMSGNAYNTVGTLGPATYKITRNIYNLHFSNKWYKSLDGGVTWKYMGTTPFAAVSYPAINYYDGNLWFIGGYDSSVNSNSSALYYLDKNDVWHTTYNYAGTTRSDSVTKTHASDLITYKDYQIYPLGNNKNDVWAISRSKYASTQIIRDSVRIGSRVLLSETREGKATVLGNNISAGVTPNTVRASDPADLAWFILERYDRGITFNGLSASNTNDTTSFAGLKMLVNASGELIISSDSTLDKGAYKLQVDGSAYINSHTSEALVINAPSSSSAYINVFAQGALRGTLDFTNGDNIDGYTGASQDWAFRLSHTITRFIPLTGTGNRMVNTSSNGTLSPIADGTAGQVLQTDGAGTYSFQTLSGSGGLVGVDNITGSGVGIWRNTTSGVGHFKRLVAGTGITITDNTDSITIDYSGGGGITGSGTTNQFAYFNSSSTLTSAAGLTRSSSGDELKYESPNADVYLTLKNSGGTTGFWRYNGTTMEAYVNDTRKYMIVGPTRGISFGSTTFPSTTDWYFPNVTNGQDAVFTVASTGTGGGGVLNLRSTAGDGNIQFYSYTSNYIISGNEAMNANKQLVLQGPGGQGSTISIKYATTNIDKDLNVGVAGSYLGTINVSGNTSGTIVIKPQAAAGSYNLNLPTTSGNADEALVSQGGGSNAMTYTALKSGTYTPTLTNTTNVAASTPYQCQWMRVGDIITVSGKVDIDPTVTGATELRLSLPITPGFANDYEAGGTANSSVSAGESAAISAVGSSGVVAVKFIAVDVTNHSYFFTFTYKYTAP